MKLILLAFLFYNSIASSTPTPGPGWIGCVFTPDAPCSYTRTMTCKILALKDDDSYLRELVKGTLVSAVNNLSRLSEQYMRFNEAPQNSSIATCNVGNI